MIDYEAVKKHFADKLASDFAGQGRFESAFYHTIKMVHDSVSAEHAERIAALEADIKTLRKRGENLERELDRANGFHERLAEQRDELLAVLQSMFNEHGEFDCTIGTLMNARAAIDGHKKEPE